MRYRTFAICLAAGLARTHASHASPTIRQVHAGSACAPDSVMRGELRAYLVYFRFATDSSELDFARGRRGIASRAARSITDVRLCERGHTAYLGALGAQPPISPAAEGTVELLRVGSYYLITERGDYDVVLTTKDWKVFTVIGLDND